MKPMLAPLGIIAGRGLLPVEIAKIYTSHQGKCYIAALDGMADLELMQNFSYCSFPLGKVKPVLDYFNQAEVKNIIFAGGINRPNLQNIKVDLMGSLLLAKILGQKFQGDDNLLRIIADFFEGKGFKVISAQQILALEGEASQLLMTKHKPSKQDITDIELGKQIAATLGELDVGQAVIVEDGYVLGVEAAEGTDNLIKRCAPLRKKASGGVLIKMMKPTQDARFDIPVIGPTTITTLIELGYNGVAIAKDKVIVLDSKSVEAMVNQAKLFMVKF